MVFVPAVEEKMFPLDRSEDIEEERYVRIFLFFACSPVTVTFTMSPLFPIVKREHWLTV